jgi:hypothetical protein
MKFSFEATNNNNGDFLLKYKGEEVGFLMRDTTTIMYTIILKGKVIGESSILPSALALLEEKLENNELTEFL